MAAMTSENNGSKSDCESDSMHEGKVRRCNSISSTFEDSSPSSDCSQTSASASASSTSAEDSASVHVQDLTLVLNGMGIYGKNDSGDSDEDFGSNMNAAAHDVSTRKIIDSCPDDNRYDASSSTSTSSTSTSTSTIDDALLNIDEPKVAARKIKRCSSRWKRRFKYSVLILIAIPALFLFAIFCEGIALLLEYRALFGSKAPTPISPIHGVLSAHINDASTSVNFNHTRTRKSTIFIDDADYQFKTYRPNPKLTDSLTQNPIRLLVVGDSIARGVGVMHSCYNNLPEYIAAIISENYHGRPVFWTTFGEPGATMKMIAKQAQHSATGKNVYTNGDSSDGRDQIDESSETFSAMHTKFSSYDAAATFSNSTNRGMDDRQYSRDQERWIQKLQLHEQLFNENPFAGYDYIIAISGVNDMKSIVLPFFVEDEVDDDFDAPILNDDVISNDTGFKGDLNRFIRTVKRIAHTDHRSCFKSSRYECSNSFFGSERMPYIIFPNLLTRHIPLKSGALLRFIASKFTGTLDSIKKVVEEENSDHVYAAPEVKDSEIQDFLENKGDFSNAGSEENVQLQMVHVNGRTCRNLTNEMTGFYNKNRAKQESGKKKYSNFYSSDAVHPNDLGYELFGKYLGNMIVKRWKEKELMETTRL
jgi:hypothetical protein